MTRLAEINTPTMAGTIDQVGHLVALSLVARRAAVGVVATVGPLYFDTAEEADATAQALALQF